MSEVLIRAQIKAIMQSVTGIGVVHDYERHSRSIAALLDLMKSGGKVNGWTIRRLQTPANPVTIGVIGVSRTIERVHTFKIAGIYDMDDAAGSEKTFQAILDAIFDAFKGNGTLNGTCARHEQFNIDYVDTTEPEEMGGDIYHIAEGTLTVYERTT